MDVARLVGAVERGERRVPLAQARLHERDAHTGGT